MRFLLDQGLPRSAAELLRVTGHETVHTAECGLSTASDADIVEHATKHSQVIVTLDADFHAIIALSGASAPSTVRIRIEGLRGQDVADIVQQVVERVTSDLDDGALISVTEDRIRVRRLPLGRHR